MEAGRDSMDMESTTATAGTEAGSTSGARSSSSSSTSSAPSPLLSHLSEGAMKVVSDLSNFVALGCLCFEGPIIPEYEQSGIWQEARMVPVPAFAPADSDISTDLSRLLQHGWVRLQYSRCKPQSTLLILRVYLLFNDKGLSFIERNNKTLLSAVGNVVATVDTDPELWNGEYKAERASKFDMWATREEENSSLFYIFNKLASPEPDYRDVQERYTREGLEDLLDLNHDVAGLKTSLYPYQRRSAGAMMHRESARSLEIDLRLEERYAPDGSRFYYSPRELQFLKEPKYQETPRGGIVAETMGYGKTLICLALIVATRHHAPKIPPQYSAPHTRPRVGSLADMAASTINRTSFPYKIELDRMRKVTGEEMSRFFYDRLDQNPPSYDIPVDPIRWNRKTITHAPQHVVIASTTIVVVPQNLCKQWKNEINKHVESGVLNLLVMEDSKVQLPEAIELMTYDVILFTRNRFDMEIQDGQATDGRRISKNAIKCHCMHKGATRTPDCHCLSANDIYSSPLRDIHFKRLIVDEGHFFSSGTTTRTMLVADRLVKADFRWVVSGTPAKDLLGVEVETQSSNSERGAILELRRSFDARLDRGGAIDSLSSLASTFLKATPWASAEAKSYLYRHEDRRHRTFSGFSVCLRKMLAQIVVKTKPEDYGRDIELPPLRHDVVVLKPSFYDKLTANLFTLVLTANAVTSERTDADYLFHKNSTKARLQLVGNLRQSAFFWSGFSEADVHASVENIRHYLAKDNVACSPEDRSLLTETLSCTEAIMSSQGWASMSRSHELGVYVSKWPADSAEHWTFDGVTSPLLTGITQLLEAQRFVNARVGQHDPGEGLSGAGVNSLATARKQPTASAHATKAAMAKTILSKAGIPTSSIDGEPLLLRRESHSAKRRARLSQKSRGGQFKVMKPRGKMNTKPQSSEDTIRRAHSPTAVPPKARVPAQENNATLADGSPYSQSRIIGTASAKLSYLCSRILEHYQNEKILVFYSGDNSAFYISQFLELFHIKHEIYAKSLSAKLKAEYVVRFQEEEDLRVLLMDVGQAAYGLNLCAASRVWFVNPVCKPDVEAQALKRAHRIGQTRPVICETLVLAGSIEQAMHERSQQMTRAEHLDAKALEDDGGIQAIIQSARLLPLSDDEKEAGIGQMAPLMKAEPLWCRPGWHGFKEEGQPISVRKQAGLVDVTDGRESEHMVTDDD